MSEVEGIVSFGVFCLASDVEQPVFGLVGDLTVAAEPGVGWWARVHRKRRGSDPWLVCGG